MHTDVKIGFDIVFDNASIGIVIANEQGHIVLANPFLLKLSGYRDTELVGQPIQKLLPSCTDSGRLPVNIALEPGRELFAVRKNGSRFPIEIDLTEHDTDGAKLVMACITNISQQRKAEQDVKNLSRLVAETEAKDVELNRANSFLRNLSELKSRFVTMASHEFRTPLSTVLSSAFLISQYPGAEDHAKREKHVQRIVSSVNMLTNILNDFLSVGKIEEGKIQVRNAVFDIRQNITNLTAELDGILKKGQHIAYTHEGSTTVRLDPELLKHIMMNLISNAVKFSAEEKRITIISKRTSKSLAISVRDEGIGISPEDREHLFERFFRGSNTNTIPGTGLGLHIIRKYTELMNGTIECVSNAGEGATFTVTFALENS
ncbi:PAS domain S-box-containing protein [Dyadobacter sp. SG02]|uniref:PAS domain-containing sensor histidine kinase n=1 Tax=Dyadobacter sp. SG02 TaxID=1855291 RepID=UPI0008C3F421|nr:PAS domain-containing sensor histidine kinase [Dyadobacter sp. SG02]SEI54488.1 PAS domain S-box-containing protein [Dyadobacter sp. SG02]